MVTKHRKVIRIRGLHDVRSKQMRANKNGSKVIAGVTSGLNSVSLKPRPTVSTKSRLNLKPVERRNQDEMRNHVDALQSILPNMIQNRYNSNVNLVLGKTLEYLRSIRTGNHDAVGSSMSEISYYQSGSALKITNANGSHLLKHRSLLIGEVASSKYWFSFDSAPFGIVICQIDGEFITSNRYFRTMNHGMHVIQSIFSVVTNEPVKTTKVPAHIQPLAIDKALSS